MKQPAQIALRGLAAETGWVVAGQGVAMIAVMLGLAGLTRFLPPAVFGQFSLALTAVNLLALVVIGPVASAASRYASGTADPNQLRHLMVAARAVSLRRGQYVLAAGLAAGVTFALVGKVDLAILAIATALFTVMNGGTVVSESILNARRLRRDVALHRGLQQSMNYGLAIVLTGTVSSTAAVALAGFAAGAACTLASELAVMRRRFRAESFAINDAEVGEWKHRIQAYARPYSRWGFFQWLQASSDRWSLAVFADAREVGLYAAAYQLGYAPLGLLATLVSQTAEPLIYQHAGDATDPSRVTAAQMLRRKAVVGFGTVAATIFVVFLIFHERLFELLLDDSFGPAAPLLPWLTLAAGVFGVAQLESVRWLARLQPERMQTARVLSSLFGVAAVVLGAGLGHAAGAVAGQLVFSLVFLWWMHALAGGDDLTVATTDVG